MFLRVAWALLGCSAFALFAAAEAFQKFDPAFPLRVVLFLACGAHLMSTLITVWIGLQERHGYRLFMPFHGGAQFVAMQGVAFTASTAALVGPIVYLKAVVPFNGITHGVLGTCGCLSAVSCFMLLRSQQLFDPHWREGRSRRFGVSGEVTLVFVLVALMGFLAFVAEHIDGLQRIASMCLVGLHFATGTLIHVVVGWMQTKNYRLFAPLQGSFRQKFVRAATWTMWCAAAVAGFGLVDQPRPFPQCHTIFGSLAILTNLGLLAHAKTAPKTPVRSSSLIARDGRFVLTLLCVFCESIAMAGAALQESRFRLAWGTMSIVVTVAMFAALPLTHLTGALVHGPAYDVWRPFHNHGGRFLTYQALGWAGLTSAVVAAAFEWPKGTSFVTATLLLLSQFAIHSAVRVFQPPATSVVDHGGGGDAHHGILHSGTATDTTSDADVTPSRNRANHRSPVRLRSEDRYLRADFLASVVVALLSLALRFSCDLVGSSNRDFPTRLVVTVSSVLWAASVPLCHMARKERSWSAIFRPFYGTPEYVALQSIGWCCYAVCCVLAVVVTVELAGDWESVIRRFTHHRFLYTAQGLVMQVPFALIAGSLYFADDARSAVRRVALLELALDFNPNDTLVINSLLQLASDLQECSPMLHSHLQDLAGAIAARHGHDGSSPGLAHVRNDSFSGTAVIIVGCLSLACVIFTGVADVVKAVTPIHSIAFLVISTAVSAATCAAVHLGYGPVVFGPIYKRWMPFRGGLSFVAWQICAGSAFSVGVILAVVGSLALAHSQDPSTISGIVAGGFFNGLAPIFTLVSVYYFDQQQAAATEAQPNFFEAHAEGIVSVLVLSATYLFTSAFDFLQSSAGGNDEWAFAVAPLLLGVLSFTIAMPLGIIAFRQSAKSWSVQLHGDLDAIDSAATATALDDAGSASTLPSPSAIVRRITPLVAIEMTGVALMMAVPGLGLVAGHFVYHRFSESLVAVIRSSNAVLLTSIFTAGVAIVARVQLSQLPCVVIDAIAACLTFSMYSMLFSAVFIVYLGLVVIQTPGSIVLALNVLVCMTPTPVRTVGRYCTLAFIGIRAGQVIVGAAETSGSAMTVLLGDFLFAGVCAWYHTLYGAHAEENGSRYSVAAATWFRHNVFWGLERYFSLRLISADDGSKICGPPSRGGSQAIFGYHPHGMFPITAVWMQATQQWDSAVGVERRVVVHAASILFNIPLVRDLCMSLSGRVVTRRAIESTIHAGLSPMIVPGGQAEMLNTAFSRTTIKITTHHRGFIRLALQHQLPLVPVFAFGEHNIMDNIHLPKIQRYFLDRFGVGFPVLPWGRWFLPLPCSTPITVVVGRAIDPRIICPAFVPQGGAVEAMDAAVVEAAVNKVADVYFEELQRIVRANASAAGYDGFDVTFATPSHKKKARAARPVADTVAKKHHQNW